MKMKVVAMLILAVPVGAIGAQTPAAPPAAAPAAAPANPITAAFKSRTLGLQRNIAQAFDSIPESKFGYRPTPAQLTIGYVAQHVASDNYFFCSKFGGPAPTVDPADSSTPDSVKAKWPKAQLVSKLKASFQYCEDSFAALTDANLADQVTITTGTNTRNVSRAAMVLGHALDVEDHYSQLANYMRLNNMIPPSALPRPPRPAGQ
jgi:hypothetical protein